MKLSWKVTENVTHHLQRALLGKNSNCNVVTISSIRGFGKEKEKAKNERVCARMRIRAREANYVTPAPLEKGLLILERFSRYVRPSLSRYALAFLFCAFAFVSLNFTICPRSPMKLQGVACAKPCYRIGELALTALRMELITIEHT